MENKMKIKGFWNITLKGPDGKVKQNENFRNLVTDDGFDGIMQRGFSTETGSASFNFVAIGSDGSAAAAGDSALGYELAVAQGAYAHTDAEDNFSLTETFAAGVATGSIREYGIQNGSPTGQLFNRAVFGEIVKGASDSLQIVFAGSLS